MLEERVITECSNQGLRADGIAYEGGTKKDSRVNGEEGRAGQVSVSVTM
jgi:hypothetical protein